MCNNTSNHRAKLSLWIQINWIQMNFYPNPDGPASLSVHLERLYRAIVERSQLLTLVESLPGHLT